MTENQLFDFRSGPKLGDIKLTTPNCIKAAKAFIYGSLDARTAAADGRTDGRTAEAAEAAPAAASAAAAAAASVCE